MAATGVKIADEVVENFKAFKLKKSGLKYITYKIADGTIVQDVQGTGDFDEFKAALPEKDCRYAVYDLDFTTNDGRPKDKIVFITWAPDVGPVKSKMVYAGSKDAITNALTGISAKINATDSSELTNDALVDAARKFA